MVNLVFYSGTAFLVAVGFMDPGKWVTLIDGGSRFGYESVGAVVFSTILAILLQTISARLGVITGKHLAQVFREEYPWAVCVLLWVLCEISIVTLDLTTVLGTAIGLNAVLQMPMLPSLFLVTIDSLLFIVILPLIEKERSEGFTMTVMGILLLCLLLESVFMMPLPLWTVRSLWPKLSHETLYSVISIVGTNIMPHNFYLHSALVKGRGHQSLSTLSLYNFLGTIFAFSAVLVMNLAVLIMSVSEFHTGGLVVLTIQDVQALLEQILNNSISPAVFGLALFSVGQLSTFNGSTAGQVVLETFLDFKIQPWQHWVWIRTLALVPAVMCIWRYGNEGTYHILIFSQVLLALHLPFTVAPLIKITSSERIMGPHKNSFLLEALAWLCIILISVVNVTLIFDLALGESEDDSSFGGLEYIAGYKWFVDMGGENLQTTIFATISLGTSLSLGFLAWLIFTPLQEDVQFATRSLWMEDYSKQEDSGFGQLTLGTRMASSEMLDGALQLKLTGQSNRSEGALLEVTSLIASPYSGAFLLLKAADEAKENSSALPVKVQEVSALVQLDIPSENPLPFTGSSSVVGSPLDSFPNSTTNISTPRKPSENHQTAALKEAEADAEALEKDDDEYDPWERLDKDIVHAPISIANGSNCSLQCEDGDSGRSVSDNSLGSEAESGSGSLSKLSGLGRAARRQFALILDEFWASLFDLHGLPLSSVAQVDGHVSKSCPTDGSLFRRCSSCEERDGKKSLSKLKSSWEKLHTIGDQVCNLATHVPCTHTEAVSSRSSQRLKAGCHECGLSSTHRCERRYSTMQMPVYHENYDSTPARIHGYQIRSCPERPVSTEAEFKFRSLCDMSFNVSEIANAHGQEVDHDLCSPGEEYRSTFKSSGKQLLSCQLTSNTLGNRFPNDKNGSDGLSTLTQKHPSEALSYDASQWESLVDQTRISTLGKWNPLVYRATGELDMNNTLGISEAISSGPSANQSPIGRVGEGNQFRSAPLVFDELSPSQSHRDGFSIQTFTSRSETQSLWSRQPFEQLFGTTDITGLTSQLSRCSSQLLQSSCSSSSLPCEGVEPKVLWDLQVCVGKLLQLDGADWLFRLDSGADEDLITAIAALQKCWTESKKTDLYKLSGNYEIHGWEKNGLSRTSKCSDDSKLSQQHCVSHCGNGCVWDGSLLISFGVWCLHRVLELCLMESRPELWGKYTYVLNRLQGILEPAFAKTRIIPWCRCLNDPIVVDHARCKNLIRHGTPPDSCGRDFRSTSPQRFSHPWPLGRNPISASASTFLDMIKEVETAVGSRKGRTGTTAGDVAFPKGKENLASVLKRYKRRLANKPRGSTVVGGGGKRFALGFLHTVFLAAIVSVA